MEENDGLYLQLAKQSKDKFNEMEKEIKELKEKVNERDKLIMCAYGLVRLVDEDINHILIERLRTVLSNYLENELLLYNADDEDDEINL